MTKFCKVFVNPGMGIAVVEAQSFTQTKALIKDIRWDSRIGWRYEPRQVRIAEMMQFNPGVWTDPSSGAVYCFEEDVEKAKVILVENINRRLKHRIRVFELDMNQHKEAVAGIPGTQIEVTVTVEE